MAEASPIDRTGRSRRGPRRRPPAEHIGDRCGMCRRKVTVDAQGRCPLGHQVIAPEVVADRAEARGEAREATIRAAADDPPMPQPGTAGGADGAADRGAADRDPRVVATYVEPAPRHEDRPSSTWSTAGPQLGQRPLTIDLTGQPGASQPVSEQSGPPAEPELPRRPSSAPVTPPHGMSAMLPVMGPDGRPEDRPAPEEVTDRLQPIPPAEDPIPPTEDPSTSVGETPRVFEDPPPPPPLVDGEVHDAGVQPPAADQSLPHRTRTPMPPRARSLFTEALEATEAEADEDGSDPVRQVVDPSPRAQVRDAAAFARIVQPSPEEAGDVGGQSGRGHAAVPLSELTPGAPSALDLQDPPWSFAAASAASPMADRRRGTAADGQPADVLAADGPAAHEQAAHEPTEEEHELELDPPRGVLQIAAGTAFVAVLLIIAWYLATSL